MGGSFASACPCLPLPLSPASKLAFVMSSESSLAPRSWILLMTSYEADHCFPRTLMPCSGPPNNLLRHAEATACYPFFTHSAQAKVLEHESCRLGSPLFHIPTAAADCVCYHSTASVPGSIPAFHAARNRLLSRQRRINNLKQTECGAMPQQEVTWAWPHLGWGCHIRSMGPTQRSSCRGTPRQARNKHCPSSSNMTSRYA